MMSQVSTYEYVDSNNGSSQYLGSMQLPYNQILPPIYRLPNQPLFPNNYTITTDNTQQPLSPIQFITTQEKPGKCYSFIAESPEIGPESDEDSIFNPSPDLLSTCNELAQNQLKNTSNEIIKAAKTQQLLATAKPFNPRQKLESVSEDEELLSPPVSVSNTTQNSVPNTINTSPFACNSMPDLQGFYDFISSLPIPDSMQKSDHISQTTHDTQPMDTQPMDTPQKPKKFVRKFPNGSKGNFYISKEKISLMVNTCMESFITHNLHENDEKLAFGYFKESVAMQINDKQIHVICTHLGDIIIINIDLHFANGDNMYLIAMENDILHKQHVQWKITQFMSADMIYNTYGINAEKLPKSSRNMHQFRYGLKTPPINAPVDVIYGTNFRRLPGKKSKRDKNGRVMNISADDLKYYCYKSWNNGLMIPVVVVKGKKQWIEWKKSVQVFDDCGDEQWVGISLRYYASNDLWKIECMDYDAGRMFYQYRLVGIENIKPEYQVSYNELQEYITTSLNIY